MEACSRIVTCNKIQIVMQHAFRTSQESVILNMPVAQFHGMCQYCLPIDPLVSIGQVSNNKERASCSGSIVANEDNREKAAAFGLGIKYFSNLWKLRIQDSRKLVVMPLFPFLQPEGDGGTENFWRKLAHGSSIVAFGQIVFYFPQESSRYVA